jgi:hypothetical protein
VYPQNRPSVSLRSVRRLAAAPQTFGAAEIREKEAFELVLGIERLFWTYGLIGCPDPK